MRFMKLSLNWKRVFTTRLTHKCTRLLTTFSLESPMDLLGQPVGLLNEGRSQVPSL